VVVIDDTAVDRSFDPGEYGRLLARLRGGQQSRPLFTGKALTGQVERDYKNSIKTIGYKIQDVLHFRSLSARLCAFPDQLEQNACCVAV
jgi:hypothetical protein